MKTKIKTIKSVFNYLPKDEEVKTFDKFKKVATKDEVAYRLIKLFTRALNKEANGGKIWIPDYRPGNNEYKYEIWFNIKANDKYPAGFGFSNSACDDWRTGTDVGSRLCFKSRELGYYAAKQFLKIYKDFILMSN